MPELDINVLHKRIVEAEKKLATQSRLSRIQDRRIKRLENDNAELREHIINVNRILRK